MNENKPPKDNYYLWTATCILAGICFWANIAKNDVLTDIQLQNHWNGHDVIATMMTHIPRLREKGQTHLNIRTNCIEKLSYNWEHKACRQAAHRMLFDAAMSTQFKP